MKKLVLLFLIFLTSQVFANIPYTEISHLDSAIYWSNQNIKERGKNQGWDNLRFEQLMKMVGWKTKEPWCSWFISMILESNKDVIESPTIRNGLARKFIMKTSIDATKVRQGLVTIPAGSLPVWQNGTTITGHIGITREPWKGARGKTIEGNTGSGLSGSQMDGDGLYPRTRVIEPRNYFRITKFTLVKYKEIKIVPKLEPEEIKIITVSTGLFRPWLELNNFGIW